MSPITARHVVAIPYPGRGHVNPMMNLVKLLANSDPDLLITVVVTEEWLGFIGVDDKPPNVHFATIPNVLPSELNRAADMPGFISSAQTKMEEPVDKLLDSLDRSPVSYIIADTLLYWAVDLGNRRNIPVASMWPMPASVFSIYYHFDLLARNGDHPFEISERGNERVNYIPGLGPIRLADTPSLAHMKDQTLLRLTLRIFPNVSKAQCLLISSMYELESQVIEALKQEFSFPIYTFGPAIPFFNLEKVTSLTNKNNDHHYFEWLNAQPPSSVLYLSLGSFLSVSNAQMDEIADGLCGSGVRFLWVARGEANRLQEKCGGVGRVIPWCEQLKVLNHPSIGGFWTHCGWNSTMEGIFSGVPIVCFPIILDQTTVRKHVVEDWKIGLDAKRNLARGNVLRSGEISNLVKNFMDLESDERREMTRRAKELQKMTREAISDGGSSTKNLAYLLDDIYRLTDEH